MRLLLLVVFIGSTVAQTLKLSPTLTIEKSDDKVKTHEQVAALLKIAKEKKFEQNVQRFIENTVVQLQKVLDAAKVVEEKKATEVPKEFMPGKYRVKSMPKLAAKKNTAKKMTAQELRKRLQDGKDLNFDVPMLVTNGSSLFDGGKWDEVKKHWYAGRLMEDERLEKDFRVEYWPPDKARARLVGSMLQMEEPEPVTFSRYVIVCFHGTPAKPKLPGQNTEHCEQTALATDIANTSEIQALNLFPQLKNALPIQAEFRTRLLEAGKEEIATMLGKKAKNFKRDRGGTSYQYFVFGPSGSGDKLKAENGLPFVDLLIHGSRRWLLMKEEEMERVAVKAREALEFDKTSAYMFFEEKLPELREEFGLKKFVELNQGPGDVVIVPSGWYRVSLALADSISYYETLLSDKSTLAAVTDNNVWRPQFRQYTLAYCFDPSDLTKLPGIDKGSQLHNWLTEAIAKVKIDEAIPGILSNLLQCGSVLSLDKAMPTFDVASLSTCTPAIWKQCRKQLAKKAKEAGKTVTLDWIPQDPPTSLDDIKIAKKDEL